MGIIDDSLTRFIGAVPVPPAKAFTVDITVHRCQGCGAVLGIERPGGHRVITLGGKEVAVDTKLCPKCRPVFDPAGSASPAAIPASTPGSPPDRLRTATPEGAR